METEIKSNGIREKKIEGGLTIEISPLLKVNLSISNSTGKRIGLNDAIVVLKHDEVPPGTEGRVIEIDDSNIHYFRQDYFLCDFNGEAYRMKFGDLEEPKQRG